VSKIFSIFAQEPAFCSIQFLCLCVWMWKHPVTAPNWKAAWTVLEQIAVDELGCKVQSQKAWKSPDWCGESCAVWRR